MLNSYPTIVQSVPKVYPTCVQRMPNMWQNCRSEGFPGTGYVTPGCGRRGEGVGKPEFGVRRDVRFWPKRCFHWKGCHFRPGRLLLWQGSLVHCADREDVHCADREDVHCADSHTPIHEGGGASRRLHTGGRREAQPPSWMSVWLSAQCSSSLSAQCTSSLSTQCTSSLSA